MIKMDFTTGQIESANSVSSNCTIIRTDDFEQSVTLMPHSMKCVLNDLINQMVAFGTDMQLTDKDKAAFQNLGLLVSKTIYVYSLLFVPEYLDQLYHRVTVDGDAKWRQENASWLRRSRRVAYAIMDYMQAGGLSRNDVAEKLGVSPQYVSKILSGKVNFSFKTISEIEEGLGIELFQAAAMEA